MAKTVGERWDETVRSFLDDYGLGFPAPTLGGDAGLAVVVRRHRLFGAGDVVLLRFSNGGGTSQPAWCRTSKGYSIRYHYVSYRKYRTFRGPSRQLVVPFVSYDGLTRLVEPPGELADLPLDHPDVRRYVVGSLGAGKSASRVSADSPAF